jgi:hypothetical protein
MGEIVNLRRARKGKARATASKEAAPTGRNLAALARGATPPIKHANWKKSALKDTGGSRRTATLNKAARWLVKVVDRLAR